MNAKYVNMVYDLKGVDLMSNYIKLHEEDCAGQYEGVSSFVVVMISLQGSTDPTSL